MEATVVTPKKNSHPPIRIKKPINLVDTEELEDAVLLRLMNERHDSESVSLNEVLDFF